jgi:hypothetical protein
MEMEQRGREHDLEVAASSYAKTLPATDAEWRRALEAGLIEADEDREALAWGPWADLYRYVAQ